MKKEDPQVATASPLFVGSGDFRCIFENDSGASDLPLKNVNQKSGIGIEPASYLSRSDTENQGTYVKKPDFYLQKELSEEFTPRKYQSELLGWCYEHLQKKLRLSSLKVATVNSCGNELEFRLDLIEDKYKLYKANFCRDRLCPQCQRRRSLKMFSQVSQILDYIEDHKKDFGSPRYAFATFTIRNCTDEELPDTINKFLEAFRTMTHNRSGPFRKNAIVGVFRSLEIKRTKNKKEIAEGRVWHPHLHCIFALSQKYFEGKSKSYMTKKDWSQLWGNSMGLKYDPIVDIRMIRNYKKGKDEIVTAEDLKKGVAECAKYSVKGDDYLDFEDLQETLERVNVLYGSLFGRRLYGFTGCFRLVRQILNQDDIEDGDLINVDGEKVNEAIIEQVLRFNWGGGMYQLVEKKMLPISQKE